MNEYTRGALDTLQMVKEVIVEIADTPIDLPTALAMIESGVRFGGELRDAMIIDAPVISKKMLAQLKSNEIALRKFSEMENVDAAWRRLAEHEAGWNRVLMVEIEGA